MKLGEAKILFKTKIIHSPHINFTDKGWVLKFEAEKKPSVSLTMEAERGGIRYFRGVRGALNACVKIGCPNAYVKLPKSKKITVT